MVKYTPGQPVPAQFAPAVKAVEAQSEPAQLTELDKHFARKEAKMQRKMAKVSAKLETLRFKHGIAASRSSSALSFAPCLQSVGKHYLPGQAVDVSARRTNACR